MVTPQSPAHAVSLTVMVGGNPAVETGGNQSTWIFQAAYSYVNAPQRLSFVIRLELNYRISNPSAVRIKIDFFEIGPTSMRMAINAQC